jgi:hypothetical protein
VPGLATLTWQQQHVQVTEQNFYNRRPKKHTLDLHHDRWQGDRLKREHVLTENGTHTTGMPFSFLFLFALSLSLFALN